MLRIPCPKCRKTSYTSDVESFRPCPYCGHIFSGKYGPDKRCETRIEQKIPFTLSYKGHEFEATTVDFSEKGLGIKIFAEAPIAMGDILNPTIEDLPILAKVVWVKNLPDQALAGLQRVN